ncbi:OLC1v1009281C1 [Oldenlandia corymbosa var. corymbosa]|uniref:OLC1v1009281C1 n=1 Tax=Oldenlandia corymbosa var. corymbosa TaxID=529605 RepID=A0AAV1DP48_OLDCO|nr:OLC1v1009281C1 [Oldenlandia corymbosa var. corymbosa]
MAVNSASIDECQGALSVPLLSDGVNKSSKCEVDNLLGDPGLKKSQICLDNHQNCQNDASVKVDIMDVYASSALDSDIEKGKLEIPKSNAETNMTEDCLPRLMQREISSHAGERFMQLLMKSSFELPKFASRDKCLTPTCRSRKYKRSVSFNSRRVVFLFSIL